MGESDDARLVVLLGADGHWLGVMTHEEARSRAQAANEQLTQAAIDDLGRAVLLMTTGGTIQF
jgi:hypothetical protein